MCDVVKSAECRICYENETFTKKMIRPCACDGTRRFVHRKCLEDWIEYSNNECNGERCQDCQQIYILSFIFPEETYTIKIMINENEILFQYSIILFILISVAFIVFSIDETYKYKYMQNYLHSQNIFLMDKSFKTDDKFIIYFYYLCAICFLFSLFVHIIFLIMQLKYIKTKSLYYYHFTRSYIWKFIYTTNFIWCIPIAVISKSSLVIFPIFIMNLINFIIFTCIFQDHNRVISLMNQNNNKKKIKDLNNIKIES